jgi:hypothetical protein
MNRSTRTADDLALLAAVDPERPAPVSGPADTERLARLKARVDVERRTVIPSRRRSSSWPRRGALLAVAAAAAIAVPLVVSGVAPDTPLGQVVSPQALAVAPDGSLRCTAPGGVGYAEAIDPRLSDVRMLPSELLAGWSLTTVFARTEQSSTCLGPSLSVVETAGDAVTGTLSVTGPFEALPDPAGMGTDTVLDDVVDGRDARLFVVFDDHHRWLWRDAEGRSWLAEVDGRPIEEARALLAGVGTEGDRVTWDAAVAPDADLVHQRTGPPYGVAPSATVWHVGVSDGTQEVLLSVTGRGDADIPLRARAEAGYLLADAGGVEFLVDEGVGEEVEAGGETDTPPGSPWAWAVGDLGPGVTVTGGWTGTADELLPILVSLEEVPADDPRIAEHALDEEYGDG